MARTVRVRPGALMRVLLMGQHEITEAVLEGRRRAARRGKEVLQSATPVDLGGMINGWHVSVMPDGALTVVNTAPYAGVIEQGARPHPVSREGYESIVEWASRHSSEEDAHAFAWAICQKIRREGQRGHFIVRDSLQTILEIVDVEVRSALRDLD